MPVGRVGLLDADPDAAALPTEASGHGSRIGLFIGRSEFRVEEEAEGGGRAGEIEGRARVGDLRWGSSTLSSTLSRAFLTGLREVDTRPLRGLWRRLGGRGLMLALH